jgi:hypothetical protein
MPNHCSRAARALPRALAAVLFTLWSSTGAAQGSAARRWLPPLQQTATIDGSSGRELNDPQLLGTTSDGKIVVFDMGDLELRAFSATGKELWTFGRKGSGPGEFRGALDLKPVGSSDIAVYDASLARLTIVTGAGQLRTTARVAVEGTALIPVDAGKAFGITPHDRQTLWRSVYPAGTAREEALPTATRVAEPLLRTNFAAGAGGTGAVVTFMWSDAVLLLDGNGAVRKVIAGPEPVPFPRTLSVPTKIPGISDAVVTRIEPKATRGALAVAATSTRVFVLFGGATADRGRLIDEYELSTGRYLGSRRLPDRAMAIAALPDNRLVTMHDDPLPQVRVWSQAPSAASHPRH